MQYQEKRSRNEMFLVKVFGSFSTRRACFAVSGYFMTQWGSATHLLAPFLSRITASAVRLWLAAGTEEQRLNSTEIIYQSGESGLNAITAVTVKSVCQYHASTITAYCILYSQMLLLSNVNTKLHNNRINGSPDLCKDT